MYAVFASGGKQYKVRPGDIVSLEKLDGELSKSLNFDQVLFASDGNSQFTLGKPTLPGATVSGEIVGQGRGDKVISFKMKRRKQFRRRKGHRQCHTEVLITGFQAGAVKASLSADEKKKIVDKFISQLREKGAAFSTPQLGSRIRQRGGERRGRTDRKEAFAKKRVAAASKVAARKKPGKKSGANKKRAKSSADKKAK